MSKISLTPNAAGTGTFNIASPGTNTDRTLTLPDAAGTVATTAYVDTTAAAAASVTNVQTFNASGTWNKPTQGAVARIQVWGGGGGASRGVLNTYNFGGGGGAYAEITVPLSTLGSSVTVTVGSGGLGRTGSTGNGTNGGTSSFGTLIFGYGGQGGLAGAAAGASTPFGVGSSDVNATGWSASRMWSGGYPSGIREDATSVFGGGGGGWGNQTARNGLSLFGGNGGDRNTAGSAPGGGGGPSSSANGNGFNGAAGRVVVTVW